MAFTEDDPRLVYLPLDKAESGRGISNVLRDRWWVVHPERGLIFYTQTPSRGLIDAAPQCNPDKNITDRVIAPHYPWAEVRQIPLVIAPG